MKSFPVVSYGWPAYRFIDHDLIVDVAPCIGGRIIALSYHGQELFYQHSPSLGKRFLLDDQTVSLLDIKKKLGFPLIGGDVVWVSPQGEWQNASPLIDLDLGHYLMELIDGGCMLTSPVCRETGLQIVRRILFKDQGFEVREEFFNRGNRVLKKGIWSVVQIPKPFDVYVLAKKENLRSYYLEDQTLPAIDIDWSCSGAWKKLSVESSECFKFGGIVEKGELIVVQKREKGVFGLKWSFDCSLQKEDYAHHSAVEVFNSAFFPYGEVEMHAPIKEIPKGGSVSFKRTLKILFPYIDNI